jgi:hypothetical protein
VKTKVFSKQQQQKYHFKLSPSGPLFSFWIPRLSAFQHKSDLVQISLGQGQSQRHTEEKKNAESVLLLSCSQGNEFVLFLDFERRVHWPRRHTERSCDTERSLDARTHPPPQSPYSPFTSARNRVRDSVFTGTYRPCTTTTNADARGVHSLQRAEPCLQCCVSATGPWSCQSI